MRPCRLRAMTGGSWARSAAIHRSAASPAWISSTAVSQSSIGEGPPRPPPTAPRDTSAASGSAPRPALRTATSSSSAFALPSSPSTAAPIMRSTGIRSIARPGSRYRASVASSPASVTLSQRSARHSGCAFARATPARVPGENPRLRPPEQLVPRERHQIHPGGHARSRRGLVRQPQPGGVGQQPGPQIVNDGHAGLGPERDQLVQPGLLGEPRHREVRPVHLQDGPHLATRDRPCVVAPTGAVGRPDGDQARARGLHDLGNPEAAADLDEFAVRHRHPPSPTRRPSAPGPPPPRSC